MTGHITINGIDFTTGPVPWRMAQAVTSTPIMQQVTQREVFRWDAAAQTPSVGPMVSPNLSARLVNGLVFYVPRSQPGAAVAMNEPASQRMAERFLGLVDAQSAAEVNNALSDMVGRPSKTLPVALFTPLNAAASYRLHMRTEYSVVQLRHAGEDLTAYFCMPTRIAIRGEIGPVVDQAAFDEAIARNPALKSMTADTIVPAKTPQNIALRRVALQQRIAELRAELAAAPVPAGLGAVVADEVSRQALARAEQEWDALAKSAGPSARAS